AMRSPGHVEVILALNVAVFVHRRSDLRAQLRAADIVLGQRHQRGGLLAVLVDDIDAAPGARENLVGEAGLARIDRVVDDRNENLRIAVVVLIAAELAVVDVPKVDLIIGAITLRDEALVDLAVNFEKPVADALATAQFLVAWGLLFARH